MELPRTDESSRFRAEVYKSALAREVIIKLTNAINGNKVGLSLDAQEVDDLCIMLQYAKKVVIEEGGELD